MKAPMTMALLFACLSLQVFSQTEKVSNRGLYVDHGLEFVTRSNASTKQLELLNYCQANHVTYIMMDGMAGSTSDDVFNTTGSGTLLNESNAHKLSAFINLSKRYGIEEVGVGLESEEGVESAETYDFDHLINLINL